MTNCLYKRLRQEVSLDGGYSWQPTGVYQTGELIEADSPYCGYHDEYVFVIPNIGRDVSAVADEDGQTITYAITSTKNGEAIDYSISAPTWATVSKSATGVTIQVAPNSAEYDRNGSIVLAQNESNVRINISVSQAGGGTAFVFEFYGGGTTQETEIPTSGGAYGYMVNSTKDGNFQGFTIESYPSWCEEVRIAGQSIRVVASANTGDEKSGAIVAKQNESNKTITINLTQEEFVIQDYLAFEAVDDGFSFYFTSDVSYSTDGLNWSLLFANDPTPAFSSGTTIYLKATLTPTSEGIGTFHNFGVKRFTVQGNPMSLLYGDNFTGQTSLAGKDNAFYELFNSCAGLTSAENMSLPATTLASNCYKSMFQGCTSLRTAPSVLPATTLANECYTSMFDGCTRLTTAPSVLPATTLTNSCYAYMFNGCTSLTTAPSLPATTLADYCYWGMFNGCTSLTTAPTLPATTLANQCYRDMFNGCTSLTTAPGLPATSLGDSCYRGMFSGCNSLTTAPELPATTLANECYYYMFKGCTSLTAAPSLPATELTIYCYGHMFNGCTSLTTAPSLPATTLATSCYSNMFQGCTSLTTVPSVLPATTLAFSCYASMFGGCTSLTTAPELPATTLTYWCYSNMFSGCTNLNKITCLATNISANGCTSNWVNGVAATGTFIKGPSMTGWTTGNDGIPSGWTVKDYGQSLILYDYIENTGTSYIDTTYEIGLNNMNTIKYYVDFVATEYNRGNNWWAHGIGGGEPFIYVGLDNGSSSSTNIPFVYGGGNRDVTTSAYGSLNQRYKCLIDYQNLTYKVTNEGGSVLLDSIITIQAPSTSTARSPYLFAWRRGSDGALGYTHSGRIYACTIFANNVCVRNLIPCIYNGTPGMYDTVNNQFHGNLGGGTFIVGNRI